MSHAPLLSTALLVLGFAVGWKCYYWLHHERLQSAEELLKRSREKLASTSSQKPSLSAEQRSKLIPPLREYAKRLNRVSVLSFLRFPESQVLANEIVSAFNDATCLVATGKAEGLDLVHGKDRYLSGIWVLGQDREIIAEALSEAGLNGIRIDDRSDIDTTCIVVGNPTSEGGSK